MSERLERIFVRPRGGGYALTDVPGDVRVEIRHLRRSYHQLHGEVDVQCGWHGALTLGENRSVFCADVNLSSQQARSSCAKYCEARAQSKPGEFDWPGLIDDACLRTIQAERESAPGIVLDDAPIEGPPRDFVVHGLSIPADSHSQFICHGDGLKSLTMLLVLGEMAKRGIPVCLLDYEWNADRHLRRKRRLFGNARLDHLYYLRGRSAITVELDHIRRFCEEREIQFLGIDSIGAACDGKLADDDVARAYNRALDHLPPSLAAAHVPKSSTDREASPEVMAFGSVFFTNYTRMSWSLKKQVSASEDVATVLYTPRKQNDGERLKPVCLEFTFDPERIQVRNVDPATVDGFNQTLGLHARLTHLLKGGPMTITAMAKDLDAKPDSVQKAVNRAKGKAFISIAGKDGIDQWALLENRRVG
jgi:hypothetical protein